MILDRVSAQDGNTFAITRKAQMRPVRHQMIRRGEPLIDDSRRIGLPITLAVIPQFCNFLETDDINLKGTDRLGNQ